jgi:hypothetical protein
MAGNELERVAELRRRHALDHRHNVTRRPGITHVGDRLRDDPRQVVDVPDDHRVRRNIRRQHQRLPHVGTDQREIEQDGHERKVTSDRLRGRREALAAFVVEAHDDRVDSTVRDLIDHLGSGVREVDNEVPRQRAGKASTLGGTSNQGGDYKRPTHGLGVEGATDDPSDHSG